MSDNNEPFDPHARFSAAIGHLKQAASDIHALILMAKKRDRDDRQRNDLLGAKVWLLDDALGGARRAVTTLERAALLARDDTRPGFWETAPRS